MADELTEDQIEQIRGQLRAGRKLVAVKLCKDWTGCSLVEAKNYVESIQADSSAGSSEFGSELESDRMDEILDAIQQGSKLNAVKLYKDSTGSSLLESKEFIERLMKELEIDDPGSAPGAKGCATLLLLIFALPLIPVVVMRTAVSCEVAPQAILSSSVRQHVNGTQIGSHRGTLPSLGVSNSQAN